METVLAWIGYGFAALFFAAAVVAWWEHLGRVGDREQVMQAHAEPVPRAGVDVDLDAPAQGDLGERRQALGGAMRRMLGGGAGGQAWTDTAPMIVAGRAGAPAAEPADTQ